MARARGRQGQGQSHTVRCNVFHCSLSGIMVSNSPRCYSGLISRETLLMPIYSSLDKITALLKTRQNIMSLHKEGEISGAGSSVSFEGSCC